MITFQKYAEAQRLLGTLKTETFTPELGYKWAGKSFIEIIEGLIPGILIDGKLKMGQRSWYKDPKSVKEFDTFVETIAKK